MLTNPPASTSSLKKPTSAVPEKKYKCKFCNRAFSRSEHRSRHERSHTKERPFQCLKCRSTFVRRDLLLRHDRTVHANDGGVPLHSDSKRRSGAKSSAASAAAKPSVSVEKMSSEHIEKCSDGLVELETAAMLMTELHHKATAAMRSAGIGPFEKTKESDNAIGTSNVSSLGDQPSTSYASKTFSTPATSWEYRSETVSRPSVLQPHSQLALQNDSGSTSYSQPPMQTTLGSQFNSQPVMQNRVGLQPRLQPAVGRSTSDPQSHSQQTAVKSTPDPQPPTSFAGTSKVAHKKLLPSPNPFEATFSDVTVGSNTALLFHSATEMQIYSSITPLVLGNFDREIILENIRRTDRERAIPESFHLPDLVSLNRFLSTYFGLFHHHLPFLHPTSFKPQKVSPSLLLAVLSIGALYDFDLHQAYICHIGSKVLVNQFLQNKENFSSRKCPLWTMQSSLLNMIFASWSGDPKGLEWACSIKSLLANMVAGNRYELKLRTDCRGGQLPSHVEWIEDEGCRRTYFAVYIFFGLLTMAYNHTPAIGFSELEDVCLPSPEDIWNLKVDERSWPVKMMHATPAPSFADAYVATFQGVPLRFSDFSTRIMINALFLEVWSHNRSPGALQDALTAQKLRLALDTWEKSLSLSEPQPVHSYIGTSHQRHQLIHNSIAVYRNARARLEVDLKLLQETLRYHDSYEVAAAMSKARDKVKRSSEMLKVIQQCYNYIETTSLHSCHIFARTSTNNWSVEYPLCGLDLMVILSLWLYRLENDEESITEEEVAMYLKLGKLFFGDRKQHTKLSSIVARIWGNLLDNNIVWGITRVLGESFRHHSQALVGYVDEIDNSISTTPSTSSQGINSGQDTS